MQGTIRHLYDPSFVPVLGQAGWSGRRLFACRPLVPDSPAAPLVAYGWLDPDGARMLGREEAALRGWSDEDLESAAHAALSRRPPPDFRPLWLGVVPALAYEGDDEHAAAQLLRRSVRVDLQRRLRSPRVAIGIPHRATILACDLETADDADLAGLVQVSFEAARMAGHGPVCPHLLVLEGGELVRVLVPRHERPTERVARRLVAKLTRSGGLVLHAGCKSEESLVDAFGRELEGIARAVVKQGGFKGVVRVKVAPEAFPATNRPMRVAAVEQLFRELAASKGLRAPNGQRVSVRVIVGDEGARDDAPVDAEPSSEVSRSSSTIVRRRRSSLLRQVLASRSRMGAVRRRRSAG